MSDEQKYAKLDHGNVWHIYRGDRRADLLFEEPQSICGQVLPDHETTFIVKRPVKWGMCERCLRAETAGGRR